MTEDQSHFSRSIFPRAFGMRGAGNRQHDPSLSRPQASSRISSNVQSGIIAPPQHPDNVRSRSQIPVHSLDGSYPEVTCLLAVWSGLRDAVTDVGTVLGASREESLEKT
jgi:hypothetical protein